jgi:hypothetical protein
MAKHTATKSAGSKRAPADPVYRFAHPFYTPIPPDQRATIRGVGKRMTDRIPDTLQPIPDPIRNPPQMTLDDVVGAAAATAIGATGSIVIHACGDTGHQGGGTEDMQEYVADAMAKDYDVSHPETSPAFFLHLGDVNYYDNTDKGYQEQFYVPYKRYPGKIVAIPGNHDGEIFKFDGSSVGQKKTLEAFIRNFVQPKPSVPPAAGTIYRQMVSQPGVYWSLAAPYVDILGLYSNVAEGPGYISAPSIGNKQQTWFEETLTKIRKARAAGPRKSLIIAVHHPPLSSGSHGPSVALLSQLDAAFAKSGIQPDMVLAAHSHDYQRYTRYVTENGKELQIPFLVAGGGGRGLSPKVAKATGARTGDTSYDASLKDYGYLRLTITADTLTASYFQVASGGASKGFDKVRVNLKTNKIV